MGSSASEKLQRLLGLFSSEDRLLIAIDADPDAMASAMALKRLLWRRVPDVSITHVNRISRPDNLAMIRLLKIDLMPIQKVDQSRFSRFALVDSQPSHHHDFEKINFDLIIDHHPSTGVSAPFVDVRPEYGATSTIMTQYLRAAKIKPSARIATALFYGIKTDTMNFQRKVLMQDVNAFQFLYRYANVHIVSRIEQAEITLPFLKYYRIALEQMRVRGRRIQVHLGVVPSADVCVSIADFLMKIQEIAWAVVSGIYQGSLIVIARNDGIRKDAGILLKKTFGNLGKAGGHKTMARAEIPVEKLEGLVKYKDSQALSLWLSRMLYGQRK